jgi:hypothetical protein
MLGRMAGTAGSTAMDFTAVDLTLAGSAAIAMAGSSALTITTDTAGGDSSVDFTDMRGGVITAPIRRATTPT